jgi:ketosteroid isomerase-like protein
MMSAENVETVRRLFKAVEERDLAGTLVRYDPEIVIREASFLPYGGTYHGHEGAKQHARGFALAWGKSQAGDEKLLDADFLDAGDRVVVLFRLKGLAAKSGRKIDVPVVGTYRVRGGKVVEYQMFYSDTTEVMQFLAATRQQ